MKTIYIYLARTGWIWFVMFGTYLIVKLKAKRRIKPRQQNEQ